MMRQRLWKDRRTTGKVHGAARRAAHRGGRLARMGVRLTVAIAWMAIALPSSHAQAPSDFPAAPARSDAWRSRVNAPSLCEAQVRRLVREALRTADVDAMPFAPLQPVVPSAAADTARRCLAQFTVATTPVAQLVSLARLARLAGEDTIAERAVARRIQLASSDVDRAFALSSAIDVFETIPPFRPTLVKDYAARLGASGPTAAVATIAAYESIRAMYEEMGDIATAAVYADTIRVRYRALSVAQQQDPGMIQELAGVYSTLVLGINMAHLRDDSTRQRLVDTELARARRDFPMATVQGRMLLGFVLLTASRLGTRVPHRLTADFWSTTQETSGHGRDSLGTTGPDRTEPQPGVVTLILDPPMSPPHIGVLRRLVARYRSRGLAVVYFQPTIGRFQDSNLQTPAEEFEARRHYLFETLHLWGTFVMQTSSYLKDGDTYIRQPTSSETEYGGGQGWAMIVGADGRVRYSGGCNPGSEGILRAVLDALL